MRWILLAAALMLSGCNVVLTKTPLFSATDAGAGPQPRLGIWRVDQKPDCAFDVMSPMVDWPECAGGVAIEEGGVAGYYDRTTGAPVWKTQPLVFASGDPMIAQAQISITGDVVAQTQPYAYGGIRPAKTDSQGRIIEMTLWPVQCGPPPPDNSLAMTKSLLPGLSAKSGDVACTTTDKAALRAAAKASEPWVPQTLLARWVRDGVK